MKKTSKKLDKNNLKKKLAAGKTASSEYSASSITVLEGLEPVRKRPGMYIGDTAARGLHHLVWEVVDNSIDEAMAGFCTEIQVRLLPDSVIEVTDNGRGVPVEKHKQTKLSALETVLTRLHAGGKFGQGGYRVSGGLHGVGVSVVNALSEWLVAEVRRDGKIWRQEYKRGKAVSKVKPVGKAKDTGTTIIFKPDPQVFSTLELDWDTITTHLRQQAYLTKGVWITVTDAREEPEKPYTFFFEGGVGSFVKFLNHTCQPKQSEVFYVEKEVDNFKIEIAVQYVEEFKESVYAFANNIHTIEGGTHLVGFRTALTRTLNNYARTKGYIKEKDANLSGDDVREGLTAVVSVKLTDPQFEGQTKTKLGNEEMRAVVDQVFSDHFSWYLEEHPKDAEQILEKCLLAAQARRAARQARETVLRKGLLEGLALPGKLADCSTKDPSRSELFIVEGDSAGGCFSGDTKIALTDGRNITFKQLVEEHKQGKRNFCYTIKEDETIGVEEIFNPRITKKNTNILKIVLDNSEEIKCTPDHLFMMRDGSYKKAKDLGIKDSLMPLKRKMSEIGGKITINGYEMVYENKKHQWIFTHLLSDKWNLWKGVYSDKDGSHRHHLDFNKLNNTPININRIDKEMHLQLHRDHASKTLHTDETKEKCRRLRRTKEFREMISKRMKRPETRKMLSERAKKQWEDLEYREYMKRRFLEFYYNNEEYRDANNRLLNKFQKDYWSEKENREMQSNRVREFFKNNPGCKVELSKLALEQWKDESLRVWRSKKTKEQWTGEFRKERKIAYNKTYYRKTIEALRVIYDSFKKVDVEKYNQLREERRDKTLLRFDTFCKRFFDDDRNTACEAVENYNHKIIKVIPLQERIDVYDIEVPGTHNFALASGVFVHNSAKSGRDRNYQAILPLRGKILNVEKARFDKMLANNEIKSLIIALGTAVGEQFDIEKLRYDRVIIMTDADVDGAHIRTLLLTLFYRYFPDIILKEHLYIARPPLYRIQAGKQVKYVFSDEEKEKTLSEFRKAKGEGKAGFTTEVSASIQRYKGLGEMNPDQLWETTMDPEKRVIMKVTVEDAQKVSKTFDILMGSEVAPRKRFIQTHAKTVKNLDI